MLAIVSKVCGMKPRPGSIKSVSQLPLEGKKSREFHAIHLWHVKEPSTHSVTLKVPYFAPRSTTAEICGEQEGEQLEVIQPNCSMLKYECNLPNWCPNKK
jgi:hypothetical protein